MTQKARRHSGPVSFSRFELFDNCPLAYRFQYIDRVKAKKPEHMMFGVAFHDFRFRYYSECREQGVDSDWDIIRDLALAVFTEKGLPLDRWEEFAALCRSFGENRPFSPNMQVEVKFGVSRAMTPADFDEADFFRGIVDGLEIREDVGILTDAKTARSTKLSFAQLRVYAAFMSLVYPEVREWELTYDFVRYNRFEKEVVLSESLREVREHVRRKVDAMTRETKWEPSPGEHCLNCPFLSRCDYRVRGIEKPKNASEMVSMMQDYWHMKATLAQMKRVMKMYVDNRQEVETDTLKAAYFPKEKMTCDKANLVRLIKAFKRNPLDYVHFPARSLKQIRYDKDMGDDAANFIFIENSESFDVKKPGQQIGEEEDL